jgi:hypothetical protein
MFAFVQALSRTLGGRRLSGPIFDPNPGQAPKLARVVGDDDQSLRARVSADQLVERPHRLAERLYIGANLAEMRSGFSRECQDLEPRGELLDGLQILQTPGGFLCAVV